MKPELKAKIIEYNKQVREKAEKADDCDVLIGALLKVPYGQLKKIIADENVVAVLEKHGYEVK
jgi:hypothetical protein